MRASSHESGRSGSAATVVVSRNRRTGPCVSACGGVGATICPGILGLSGVRKGEAGSCSSNPPKTIRGRRMISLSPYLVDTFRQHQQRNLKLVLPREPDGFIRGGWVCTTRTGNLAQLADSHRRFKQLLKAATFPETTIHDLSHGYVLFNEVVYGESC